MTSNRLKKKKLKAKRMAKEVKHLQVAKQAKLESIPPAKRVNKTALSFDPCPSYSMPNFVERGFYEDKEFLCSDCGAKEIWFAEQQKWWYEVKKSSLYTKASRCVKCRRKKQEHRYRSIAGMKSKSKET